MAYIFALRFLLWQQLYSNNSWIAIHLCFDPVHRNYTENDINSPFFETSFKMRVSKHNPNLILNLI